MFGFFYYVELKTGKKGYLRDSNKQENARISLQCMIGRKLAVCKVHFPYQQIVNKAVQQSSFSIKLQTNKKNSNTLKEELSMTGKPYE